MFWGSPYFLKYAIIFIKHAAIFLFLSTISHKNWNKYWRILAVLVVHYQVSFKNAGIDLNNEANANISETIMLVFRKPEE